MTAIAFAVDAVTGSPEYDGSEIRAALGALSSRATDTRPLGAVSGVRYGTPDTTVHNTGFTWYCDTHAGIVDEHTAAGTGPYLYAVTAQESGTITAAHGTHPRLDILYIQIDDPSADASSVPAVNVGYLAGTAAASPAAPATPERSIVLAHISVPASGGGDPSVLWKAQVSPAAGGLVPVPDVATRDTLAAALDIDAFRPLMVYVADQALGSRLQITGDGTTWETVKTTGQDQPWTTLTANADWTAGTGDAAPKARRIGDTVWFRGSLFGGTNSTATVLPTWARPALDYAVPISNQSTNATNQVLVRSNGELRPRNTATTSTIVNLHATVLLSWPVG